MGVADITVILAHIGLCGPSEVSYITFVFFDGTNIDYYIYIKNTVVINMTFGGNIL